MGSKQSQKKTNEDAKAFYILPLICIYMYLPWKASVIVHNNIYE
jgi:hypothetical protein